MPTGVFQVDPGVKLFLSTPECQGAFGGGKCHLLLAVRQTGSIRQAALQLGRSYRKAWGDIKKAEAGLNRRLVRASRGGPGGGSAELTEFAEELVRAWEEYRAEVLMHADLAFDRHLRPILESRAESGTSDGEP